MSDQYDYATIDYVNSRISELEIKFSKLMQVEDDRGNVRVFSLQELVNWFCEYYHRFSLNLERLGHRCDDHNVRLSKVEPAVNEIKTTLFHSSSDDVSRYFSSTEIVKLLKIKYPDESWSGQDFNKAMLYAGLITNNPDKIGRIPTKQGLQSGIVCTKSNNLQYNSGKLDEIAGLVRGYVNAVKRLMMDGDE